MEDSLRQYAVETKYNGLEDETTEELKDYAIINAVITDLKFPNRKNRVLSVRAFRSFEGKDYKNHDFFEIDSDNKTDLQFEVVFQFYLLLDSQNKNDKKEYDKVTFVIDGKRVDLDARSEYWDLGLEEIKTLKYEGIRKVVMRGNVVTINGWDNEHWDPNDYFCLLNEDSDIRSVATVIPNELIEFIAEAESVSMYVDSSELIDVNGGHKNFEDENGSFEIEGIQGFMKRVYHFFIDDSCYTDYCLAFYDKKTKAAEKREQVVEQKAEREEQEAYDEAIKLRNIYLVVTALSLLLLILGLSFEWGFFWSILLPVIGGGYSIFNIGRLYDIW
jgi:hypothetical protein